MEKFKLKVEPRRHTNPREIRRQGDIPATIYGPGEASESVQVNAKEFSRLPAAAFSHIVELDGAKDTNALIRNVHRRATTHEVLNIEFYRVSKDRKLTVTVPFKFVGSSTAVSKGGQLIENYLEAEIECLPGDIPDFIEVDISVIEEIDTGIHFSEVKVSDNIKILNPLDEIVVRVVTPRAVQGEEAPKAAEAAAAAPAEAAAAPAAAKTEKAEK